MPHAEGDGFRLKKTTESNLTVLLACSSLLELNLWDSYFILCLLWFWNLVNINAVWLMGLVRAMYFCTESIFSMTNLETWKATPTMWYPRNGTFYLVILSMFHRCHQTKSPLSRKSEMYEFKCNLKIEDGLSFFQGTPTNWTRDVLLQLCTKINFLNPPTWIPKVRHLLNVLVLKKLWTPT